MPPRNDTASNVTLTDDNVNTTEEPPAPMRGIVIDGDMHTVVLGLLIALIIFLCVMLGMLLWPCIRRLLRKRAFLDKKQIAKRYKTIDAWLITKVCTVYYCTLYTACNATSMSWMKYHSVCMYLIHHDFFRLYSHTLYTQLSWSLIVRKNHHAKQQQQHRSTTTTRILLVEQDA